MHAAVLNCTLKASPEPSSTEALARVVMTALEERGVTTDLIRLADFDIAPGVVSEPVREGESVFIAFAPEDAHLFDAASGARLA